MSLPRDIATFAVHGGALDLAQQTFPAAPLPWIDLSTGINPVPYPLDAALAPSLWARLPDAADLAALERAAAERYRLPPGAGLVAAPGTQAVIQRLPALAGGRDIRVLGPTYGEYERVFRHVDARVSTVAEVDALAGADLAVVANPNNPDGRFVAPTNLEQLAQKVGLLVVDEAFADALGPDGSVIPRLAGGRILVLRSFGKIFGLAGLRLGFAAGPAACCDALRGMLGPWPVSGPAVALGRRALADTDWLATTRLRLRADGERLGFLLKSAGGTAVGATPLFRLIGHPVAPDLFRALAQAGILTRPFAKQRTWLRFGLPKDEGEWGRLGAALACFSCAPG